MNYLIPRLIFKLYFAACKCSGGRDSAPAKWLARHVVQRAGRVPLRRCGLYLELNPVGFVDWCLMARGEFEPDVRRIVERALAEGGVMLDIGANIGVFSLAAAALPDVTVFAFEPSPRELQRLHRNLALNPDLPIVAFPFACSTEARVDQLNLASCDNPGANSMSSVPYADGFEAIQIRCCNPCELIAPATLQRVRLVKIDVEGYEPVVLRGLAAAMPELQRALFVVEINPNCAADSAGDGPQEIYSQLAAAGFVALFGPHTARADAEGKYDELFFHPSHYQAEQLQRWFERAQ